MRLSIFGNIGNVFGGGPSKHGKHGKHGKGNWVKEWQRKRRIEVKKREIYLRESKKIKKKSKFGTHNLTKADLRHLLVEIRFKSYQQYGIAKLFTGDK